MKIFSFFFSHFDFFIFCCSGRNGRRNEMKSRHRDFEHIMDTFPDYERGLDIATVVISILSLCRHMSRPFRNSWATNFLQYLRVIPIERYACERHARQTGVEGMRVSDRWYARERGRG